MNALSPERMTAAERLAELATILAVGVRRLQARQSTRISVERENSFVDFTANQSGHAAELEPVENGA
ncbi:hypothetical protein [Mesorhizobium kowhaii]|uniref:Uncharacterized protein n=1 Tax=Mesorhizobium kowhaii TaxID=1300272 RepID=A0A2W7C9T9_9HYPH|nr:hypothetical protein [Mesorhizobium kowhaii]PZV39962.1 hypothetical protein B5V02_03080 [Mesorhizobium kowhaii]